MPSVRQTSVPMWVHQPDAVLNQANPVSGTKYTVLDTVKNVRIVTMIAECTWTVDPDPLEIHATIDGKAYRFIKATPTSVTAYEATIQPQNDEYNGILADLATYSPYKTFLLECKSIKVEAEITGGTVQSLDARIKYALRR